jgi:hypothetical protein
MEPFNFTKKLDLELTKEGAWTAPSPIPSTPSPGTVFTTLQVLCKLPVGPFIGNDIFVNSVETLI